MKEPQTYQEIGKEIGDLVSVKQEAYGDSFGKSQEVLKILYPHGITVEQFAEALTLVRIIDKLFRVATDRDALGESPYRDIAGYAILAIKRIEDEKRAVELSINSGAEDGGCCEHGD